MSGISEWLRVVANSGGKGTCDNIDARALGRAADEIDRLRASHVALLAAAKQVISVLDYDFTADKHVGDFAFIELQAAIAKAEELAP
jgi:hypothetical protein